MSTLKTLYGTANQAITITMNSLGYLAYRQSTSVDNGTNLFLDVLVTVKAKGAASGVGGSGTIQIFAYGTADGGTNFDGSASGTDGTYTPPATPPNLAYLGTLNITGNAVVDQRTFSLAQAFGGSLPQKWGIIVFNNTLQSLDASAGGSAWYQGVQAQTV